MSFKIDKASLKFAVDLCSKTIARRAQEELVYRAVRIVTFENGDKKYVAFSSNGGYNAVQTTGFEIKDFTGDAVDILVDCRLLSAIIDKSSVEEITLSLTEDKENLVVKANGTNKLKCFPGDTIAEFPVYDETKLLGEIKVKDFLRICRLAIPFSTVDVHAAPTIGLCIENDNMYASDELKGNSVEKIGLKLETKLNFDPIAAEVLKSFSDASDIKFYLGKISSAREYTNLVMSVNGMDVFILKYQTDYPSKTMEIINTNCRAKNTNKISFNKSEARQVFSRIGIFLDDNDLLAITPGVNQVKMEVINAKTNELGEESIAANVSLSSQELLGKKIYVGYANFGVLLETLDGDTIILSIADKPHFVSVNGETMVTWITTKNVE